MTVLQSTSHHVPSVGEAVPQALAVTPEQPVEDTVEEPVEVEAVYVGLPPDPLQRWANIGTYNVQHLKDKQKGRKSEWVLNPALSNEGN